MQMYALCLVAALPCFAETGVALAVLDGGVLKLLRSIELSDGGVAEVASHLHPTFAYMEDQLGSRPEEVLTCGFGRSSDDLAAEIGQPCVPLRSRYGLPDQFNAGMVSRRAAYIAPGVVLLSDPVELDVPPLTDLAVSLYLPGETGPPTTHATGLHNTYISKEGDLTAKAEIPEPVITRSYYWLAGIDVAAGADAALLVTFGDSITDGALSTTETNHSWPALLAARLAANKATANIAVVNEGIGGNRVLRDGAGASALARFDRDVLSQPGVKWVTLMEGINDIGHASTAVPTEPVTTDELIGAYKQFIAQAHAHGIQVIGCTLTPYEGAGYYRPDGERIRAALNSFIRTSGAFDAVVDFEAATRDAANASRLREEFDPGDHLHPNDTGYQAMADAFDLKILTGGRASKPSRDR